MRPARRRAVPVILGDLIDLGWHGGRGAEPQDHPPVEQVADLLARRVPDQLHPRLRRRRRRTGGWLAADPLACPGRVPGEQAASQLELLSSAAV